MYVHKYSVPIRRLFIDLSALSYAIQPVYYQRDLTSRALIASYSFANNFFISNGRARTPNFSSASNWRESWRLADESIANRVKVAKGNRFAS